MCVLYVKEFGHTNTRQVRGKICASTNKTKGCKKRQPKKPNQEQFQELVTSQHLKYIKKLRLGQHVLVLNENVRKTEKEDYFETENSCYRSANGTLTLKL